MKREVNPLLLKEEEEEQGWLASSMVVMMRSRIVRANAETVLQRLAGWLTLRTLVVVVAIAALLC